MMKIIDPGIVMPFNGALEGEGVEVGEKLFADARSFYKFADGAGAPEDSTVMYEVRSYEQGDQTAVGNLNWGVTKLFPVTVNGECNMTRGHWHEDRTCVEWYYGMEGEGLLMLMDDSGRTWAEKVFPGSLHYIEGDIAHRLINTGDIPMVVGACWSCCAGHDYAAVETKPFGVRVFKEQDGSLRFEEREN